MTDIKQNPARQQELYEQACRDMAAHLPGWSDAFPSDPAVAVLEHLTFLSDIQNHVLDQIGDAHYLAYCKLLHSAPKVRTPARLLAQSQPAAPCVRGQRFRINGVPFEVTHAPRPHLPQVRQVYLERGEDTRILEPGVPLPLAEKTPYRLVLQLTGPLSAQTPETFWLTISHSGKRNPPDADTVPPVTLRACVRTQSQWQEASCQDGTCGFLQSGPVTITASCRTDTVALEVTGAPEGTPVLQDVVPDPAELTQQHTRSVCADLFPPFALPSVWLDTWTLFYFTPHKDGWRRQAYTAGPDGRICGWKGSPPDTIRVVAAEPDFHALRSLEGIAMETLAVDDENLWPAALRVMVEEDGIWYDCPVCAPDPNTTRRRGCRWDSKSRAICFGDGRDYLPPAPGQALICGCALTLGSAANGAGGTLESGDTALTAIAPAQGGQDDEPPKEAFLRTAREQEQPLRAVTCRDYETLARQTPGLALEQVRALPSALLGHAGPGVVVLAKPASRQSRPILTPWQQERLRTFLEPYRLLGVPLEIRSPRYCPIRVQARLLTSDPVDRKVLRQAVLMLVDGVDGPVDFGTAISYTAVYAALGRVNGVRAVRALDLTALTSGTRSAPDGSILLSPDMLPCLAELDVTETQ